MLHHIVLQNLCRKKIDLMSFKSLKFTYEIAIMEKPTETLRTYISAPRLYDKVSTAPIVPLHCCGTPPNSSTASFFDDIRNTGEDCNTSSQPLHQSSFIPEISPFLFRWCILLTHSVISLLFMALAQLYSKSKNGSIANLVIPKTFVPSWHICLPENNYLLSTNKRKAHKHSK